MKLSEFDFSELAHYIDCLEASGGAEERQEHADIINRVVQTLPAPLQASALMMEASRYAAWGGTFEHVRREFASLAAAHAGWSAAKVLQAEQRADAAEHGKRGGRPPSEGGDEWLAEFDELRAKNPTLTATAIYQRIAARLCEPRHWRTVARGINRARNARQSRKGGTPHAE
jgi:hypothetical protein